VAGLQLTFDCCWVVAKICGLQVRIKGKSKTAYMATYWMNGKEHDVEMGEGFGIRMPDEEWVPQIKAGTAEAARTTWGIATARKREEAAAKRKADGQLPLAKDKEIRTYTHLGTGMTPRWKNGQEVAREAVRKDAIAVITTIGRIPGLSNAQMANVMNMATNSLIGYTGRCTAIRMEDCEAIEAARTTAMQRRGYSPGAPRHQIYDEPENGGLGHKHAYSVAAPH
jgi:hypothetical protein